MSFSSTRSSGEGVAAGFWARAQRWKTTSSHALATQAASHAANAGPEAMAVHGGFVQIVKTMSGTIDNTTFLAAAGKAKIDLPGMVPPLDFSQPWNKTGGPKGFDRIFNHAVVYSKLENGKLKPLTTEFEDVTNLALGKPE